MFLGGVGWVLVVIASWMTIAAIVVLLIRFVSRENDDEQIVCELTPDYFAEQPATA
jgi:hypothetical protein